MASVNTTTYIARFIGMLGGLVRDNITLWGWPGEMRNMSAALIKSIIAIPTAGVATVVPITAFPAGLWDLGAGATGAFTLTLPATQAIIAAYPNTIPQDGQFIFDLDIMNDGIGQTATLTAGDANTTILGTATIANNTNRTYTVNINVGKGTIFFMNKGSKGL